MKKLIMLSLWALLLGCVPTLATQNLTDLAKIQTDRKMGFSNGGWCYDKDGNIQHLKAGGRSILADLEGPGVIRHIHITRHKKVFELTTAGKETFARGIVLEIWFDDANEPAVMSPLADFFGDGCNGNSMYFTSNLIECAPWSYNCYFTMPFKSRAKVMLRNDTDQDTISYSYVEWEPLSKWNDSLGYFHATYQRKCFQLTKDTDETFFEIKGTGHLIGRQYSIVTDEPIFKKFFYVMEGDNEVDIDGKARTLNYLGTEDSFTFSWGFQNTFTGLRAGMPLVERGDINQLSIYRFHDHMPIRFNKQLRWHITWKNEKTFIEIAKWAKPWAKALARDGCWVDYATVHYWYQSIPGGYKHKPLHPVAERQKLMLKSNTGRR